MNEEYYITKTIEPDNIKSGDDDDTFIGRIKMNIATTHKDRVGDILTKNFLNHTAKSLMENNSFFYNHKTTEDPIGKVISAKVSKLEDGEYSTVIEVGISKTAEKQWQLIQEGILNKGSIGFLLTMDDMEYDEEKDALIINDGEVIEASLVGVPANKMASVTNVSKKMKSMVIEKHNKTQSINKDNVGDNMDTEQITKLIDEKLKALENSSLESVNKVFEEKNKKLEQKNTEFELAVKKYEEKLQAIEKERDEFKKALEEGRQTGGNSTPAKDKFFLEDKDMALNKGFYEIGKLLQSGESFTAVLSPSRPSDFME